MASPYLFDYTGSFDFSVERMTMWAALQDTGSYERWWEWMRELQVDGSPAIAPGSAFSFKVVGPIPFSMHLEVRITDVDPGRRVAATVHRDLRGTATMRFEDRDGGSTAHLSWQVELMQRAMRAGARVAHPVLKWGHDWAIASALKGFNRHLATGSPR